MSEIEKKELPEGEDQKYIIHIDNFDGPLDLLWGLIKKASIDVTDISISQITEQYIGYLRVMEQMNIQVASDFIVMASELLYYKTKALLPGEDIEDEYFVPPLPPELVAKLLEYKKYQNAARELRSLFELHAGSFSRQNAPWQPGNADDYIEVSLFDLLSAFAAVMDASHAVEQEEIIFDEILISDRITFITNLLHGREHILFTEILMPKPVRAYVVATLLAVLEMTRTGRIRLQQHRVFGEIRILRTFLPEQQGNRQSVTPAP
jgi:segregation and condensation protein A